MNDQQIEKEIVEKGKTAPRVTPEHIASIIASEHYFTAADGARFAHVQRSETYSVKIP
ncbi:TPA: Gp49 family protein, partial [Escherichia coli]